MLSMCTAARKRESESEGERAKERERESNLQDVYKEKNYELFIEIKNEK